MSRELDIGWFKRTILAKPRLLLKKKQKTKQSQNKKKKKNQKQKQKKKIWHMNDFVVYTCTCRSKWEPDKMYCGNSMGVSRKTENAYHTGALVPVHALVVIYFYFYVLFFFGHVLYCVCLFYLRSCYSWILDCVLFDLCSNPGSVDFPCPRIWIELCMLCKLLDYYFSFNLSVDIRYFHWTLRVYCLYSYNICHCIVVFRSVFWLLKLRYL